MVLAVFGLAATGGAFAGVQRGLSRASPLLRGVVGFSRRKPLGALGAAILLVLALIALLAPLISPHDPEETLGHLYVHAAPFESSFVPLGGDRVGRDVMSRLFYGARVSLYVGAVSVVIGITLGSLVGVVSAYYGGAFDLLTQRLVDTFMAFPSIILGLAIMALLGSSLTNVIIALVVILVPTSMRTIRSQALAVKEMDYVLAARAVGAGDFRIIFFHVAPNCVALFMVLVTIQLGFAILVEASLSFLGAGLPANVATWGGMLSEAGTSYIRVAPWLSVWPGLAISLTVFGVNMFGDALRDVLDPRLRGAG